jgi:hypothetical protein
MRDEFTPKQIDRFWSRVDRSGGPDACWLWTGATHFWGYGRVGLFDRVFLTHRLAFFLEYGWWPEPYCCHACDNPPCVNPAHLFACTATDNMRDCCDKGRIARHNRLFGEDHPRSRLTEGIVREIRQRRSEGASLRQLSTEYDILPSSICGVVKRRSWKHV